MCVIGNGIGFNDTRKKSDAICQLQRCFTSLYACFRWLTVVSNVSWLWMGKSIANINFYDRYRANTRHLCTRGATNKPLRAPRFRSAFQFYSRDSRQTVREPVRFCNHLYLNRRGIPFRKFCWKNRVRRDDPRSGNSGKWRQRSPKDLNHRIGDRRRPIVGVISIWETFEINWFPARISEFVPDPSH